VLTSPRRIAVVVLVALVGWLLQHFAGLQNAVLPAVLVGFLIANFVPTGGGCSASPADDPGAATRRDR
jgi:hypothetical protein